jgi:hypothetical protein
MRKTSARELPKRLLLCAHRPIASALFAIDHPLIFNMSLNNKDPIYKITTLLSAYNAPKKKNGPATKISGTTNKTLDDFDSDISHRNFLVAVACLNNSKYTLKKGKLFSFSYNVTGGKKAPT